MMIFSLVAMIGLEKCCITAACLQWLCHSGERIVACVGLLFSNFPLEKQLAISFVELGILFELSLNKIKFSVWFLKKKTDLTFNVNGTI